MNTVVNTVIAYLLSQRRRVTIQSHPVPETELFNLPANSLWRLFFMLREVVATWLSPLWGSCAKPTNEPIAWSTVIASRYNNFPWWTLILLNHQQLQNRFLMREGVGFVPKYRPTTEYNRGTHTAALSATHGRPTLHHEYHNQITHTALWKLSWLPLLLCTLDKSSLTNHYI